MYEYTLKYREKEYKRRWIWSRRKKFPSEGVMLPQCGRLMKWHDDGGWMELGCSSSAL